MNCRMARSLIHLRESDDVSERERAELERHLDCCEACAAYATEIPPLPVREVRMTHPLTTHDFAEIRKTVMSTVRATPRRGWNPTIVRFALASAAIVAILAVSLIFRDHGPAREPAGTIAVAMPEIAPEVELATEPAAIQMPENESAGTQASLDAEVMTKSAVPHRRRAAQRSQPPVVVATRTPLPTEPMRLEIQTSDPNIRIIWVTSEERIDESSGAAE